MIFLRVFEFLRFAVPRPYPETIYGSSVCVKLIIKSQSLINSSRSSSPSTSVDVARESIPVDDLREWISIR